MSYGALTLELSQGCEVNPPASCELMAANIDVGDGRILACGERCLSAAILAAEMSESEMRLTEAVAQNSDAFSVLGGAQTKSGGGIDG